MSISRLHDYPPCGVTPCLLKLPLEWLFAREMLDFGFLIWELCRLKRIVADGSSSRFFIHPCWSDLVVDLLMLCMLLPDEAWCDD